MTALFRASRRALSPAVAQLAGWAILAAVNALVIEWLVPMPPPPMGHRLRALHHLYDAGQLVGLGVIAWTGVGLWRLARGRVRLLRRRGYDDLALALFATAAGVPLLTNDLTGAASRPFGARGATIALAVLLGGAGLLIVAAARAGRLAARFGTRSAGVAFGLSVGVANQFVLPHDYAGVHFYLAWVAATMMGTSLAGVRLRFALPRVALPLLAVPTGLALGKIPANSLQLELLRLPGAVAAPFVARAGMTPAHAASVWRDTEPHPDIPASMPPLIPPDGIVLVLVVDALRADVIADGAHAARLPEMEQLRRASVDFTRARSPASGTIWTISSVFSGRYYSQLYWTVKPDAPTTRVYPHEDTTVRFPQVLGASGIHSVTVSEMPDVTDAYGVVRGVTEEHPLLGLGSPAGALVDILLDALSRRDGPRFAYVHFLDAHAPYERITRRGSKFERYLGELALIDHEIGRLRRVLAQRGLDRKTTIVLTADHGEAFGEHGTWAHAVSVYEELLRVPLLIHVPGVAPRRVDREVSLLDLGPTVLDLMGQPTPGSNMGESLVPFLRGLDPALHRPIAAETGRMQQAMIFSDGFKVIRDRMHGTFELYDLAHDPGEIHNLTESPGVNVADYLGRLDGFFYAHTLRRTGYSTPIRW